MSKLNKPLTKLKNMVGMEDIKKNIIYLILLHSQKLDTKNKDLLHTVIQGPPGVGKTKVAEIIADIYMALGILSSNKVKKAKRDDFIAEYLGQTSHKTRKFLDSCDGCVLFIDEAYSLGDPDKKDHYSREAIDILVAYLTEQKENFVCVLAGYKKALDECFFNFNEGLERRFPYRFSIEEYNPDELRQIFIKIVYENEWTINNKNLITENFFKENKEYFKHNGGDMEILFQRAKLAHSKRIFGMSEEKKKNLNFNDIKDGLKLMLINDNIKNRNDTLNDKISFMYS